MTGKMKDGGNPPREVNMSESTNKTFETEVTPHLPTSGQILGVLVKTLGIEHPKLQSKTANRYFSGHLEGRVKESSRNEIIKAIAETLVEQGVGTSTSDRDDTSSTVQPLTTILDHHAVKWDRLRSLLRPRMPRVFPSHLPDVWKSYVRLAAIDLALRVAAQMRLSGTEPIALNYLDWVEVDRRGKYLDSMRSEAGIPSLWDFSCKVGVDISTMETWVYGGSRPSGKNLRSIGRELAKKSDSHQRKGVVRALRRLYWTSELALVLGEYIGTDAVTEIVHHLKFYAALVYDSIDDHIEDEARPSALADILDLGAGSRFSEPLLHILAGNETDDEWNRDILAAGSDWIRRVVAVNYQVHRAEVEDLIQRTDGDLLRNWDVSNPEAYAHYERSMELQIQGEMPEALAEVAKAAVLDPLDPANHFTLGSVKGGMGAKSGNAALIEEGLEECWLAAELDPSWILPWIEIGKILFMAGREKEAVEHLRRIGPERGYPDSYYFTALGLSLRQLGMFAESIEAFESALELNPDDPPVVVATAVTGMLAGDRSKSNLYRKMARHMGFAEELDWDSALVDAAMAVMPSLDIKKGKQLDMAALNAAVRRNPQSAAAYLSRAVAFYKREDDKRATSDLDEAIRLAPRNSDAYLLRGIIHGHMKHFGGVISDETRAILLGANNAMAHFYRGVAYGEQRELALAIADFDEAIRLEPSHVDARRCRGDCLRFNGEYDLAITDYNEALKLDPEHTPSYFGRGMAYRQKLDFDRAIADYDVTIRLAPDNSLVYRFRGYAHAARGEMAFALADFNSSVESEPKSAIAYQVRGVAREVMGDAEGATEDYRRARELGYED